MLHEGRREIKKVGQSKWPPWQEGQKFDEK